MMVSGLLFISSLAVSALWLPVDSENGDFGVWALASELGLSVGWGFSAMFGVGDLFVF